MNLAAQPDYAESLSPIDGALLARYPCVNEAALEALLDQAGQGCRVWRNTALAQRLEGLRQLAALLLQDAQELAGMATPEMGKPLAQSLAEVEKCALLCEWYAEHGAPLLADQPTAIGPDAYISFLPIGPILGVMPWNCPFWQALRGAVPILLAGNGYVLKHAPNVMGCAYLLARCVQRAGLPAGTFSVLNATPALISRAIADRRIAGVAVTGSVRAGRRNGSPNGDRRPVHQQFLHLGSAPAHRRCEKKAATGGSCPMLACMSSRTRKPSGLTAYEAWWAVPVPVCVPSRGHRWDEVKLL